MSVRALRKGPRLRANGAFLQLRERFFGVTVARTVTQVIEAAKARIAEIDAEQGRHREEMIKAFALAPSFGGDVEAVRRLVEQYDVIQLTMNGIILNKPVRELVRHAMVMNLIDQLRGSYASVSEQLQIEVESEKTVQFASGTFGGNRVMSLYFHDMSMLLPVDFEEIESHIHWPMNDMIDGEYAVQPMQMSPADAWLGGQQRRRPIGGGRLPPQEVGTFAELETTLRAHAKADGEQDA